MEGGRAVVALVVLRLAVLRLGSRAAAWRASFVTLLALPRMGVTLLVAIAAAGGLACRACRPAPSGPTSRPAAS